MLEVARDIDRAVIVQSDANEPYTIDGDDTYAVHVNHTGAMLEGFDLTQLYDDASNAGSDVEYASHASLLVLAEPLKTTPSPTALREMLNSCSGRRRHTDGLRDGELVVGRFPALVSDESIAFDWRKVLC